MNIICFHKPDEENGYLSNWYPSCFTIGGISFTSMEQYMMHSKAIAFKDTESAARILGANDAATIKRLGRAVKNYDENHWNGIRQIIVYEGLYAKFSQNEELKKRLILTGDAILAECAVNDVIWGIGLSMHSAARFDRAKWKGQSLLGYAIMQVREKLISEQARSSEQ